MTYYLRNGKKYYSVTEQGVCEFVSLDKAATFDTYDRVCHYGYYMPWCRIWQSTPDTPGYYQVQDEIVKWDGKYVNSTGIEVSFSPVDYQGPWFKLELQEWE